MTRSTPVQPDTILVCSCDDSIQIDEKALNQFCPNSTVTGYRNLCRGQLADFERHVKQHGHVMVACTQEAPLFLEAVDELHMNDADARFVNIREMAGWCKDHKNKATDKNLTAKMAALIQEARLDILPTPSVSMKSDGIVLIIGQDEKTIDYAKQLASRLDVTVVLENANNITMQDVMTMPVFYGKNPTATGHLGQFSVTFKSSAAYQPSAKDYFLFGDEEQNSVFDCDLILDLRGKAPLFTSPETRDGYFNPEAKNQSAIMKALFELTDLVGEFEKPRYIDYQSSLCAHGKSGITGCTLCIDNCSTGAIIDDGEKVKFDAYICAGCGSCASLCPTGAAHFDMPAADTQTLRLKTLLGTYKSSGGKNPSLVLTDQDYGQNMIHTMARFTDGLATNVIPFTVNQVTQVGLDFFLSAAAYGAEQVFVILPPEKQHDRAALETQSQLAEKIYMALGYGGERIHIIDESDPDKMTTILRQPFDGPTMPASVFSSRGRKRSLMNAALNQLHKNAPSPVDVIPLDQGAPFGTLNFNVEKCTLCLACVGSCPTGALKDNQDAPQLSFVEDACVQCGICKNTCPEKIITLDPRISFKDESREAIIIKREEPFHCTECGTAFGTQSTIENMIEKLSGHAMFQNPEQLARLKMCQDCRVVSLANEEDQPMAYGDAPKVRTTDDYLREREELRQLAAADMKAKGLNKPH